MLTIWLKHKATWISVFTRTSHSSRYAAALMVTAAMLLLGPVANSGQAPPLINNQPSGFQSFPSQSPPVVELDELSQNKLGGTLRYIQDKRRELTPLLIQRQLHAIPWKHSPAGSFTTGNVDSSYWLTTMVRTGDNPHDWIIDTQHPGIDHLEAWILQGDSIILYHQMGDELPFAQRPLQQPEFAIPIHLQANTEYQLIFRLRMAGLLDFPLQMATAQLTHEESLRTYINQGIFYGTAMVLVVYHLLMFVLLRDFSYLFYTLFTAMMCLFLSINDGTAFRYVWPDYPVINQYALLVVGSLSHLFINAFCFTFLQVRKHNRGLSLLLHGAGAVNLLALATSLITPGTTALNMVGLSAAATISTLLIAGCYMWYRGLSYARHFTLIMCFFLGLCGWLTLIASGVLEGELASTWQTFRVGTAIMLLLLALAVASRNNFLTRIEEKARGENEAEHRFIAQVSHELRTPMNGILGMSALLRDHLNSKEATHYNNVIYQSGLALLGTINDVLDIAKFKAADKLEVEYVPFNLHDLCKQSLYVIEPQAMVKSLSITHEWNSSLPDTVEGDPNRIRQILLNFLSNAAKFTERGSIILKAEPMAGSFIRLSVIDTGCGIPEAEQQRIFEPYVQHNTNPAKAHGTGLGLYICSRLAQVLGGTIGITSTPDEGSEFWIELPLPASEQTAVPLAGHFDQAVMPNREEDKLEILVAEDNAANQMVIEKLLFKMGHRVTVVNDGQQALDQFRHGRHHFDLILMDCEMPNMDGYTATEHIRRIEREQQRQPIPIVALTAHALQEYRERCFTSGMTEVLTKPIKALTLQQTLLHYSQLLRGSKKFTEADLYNI